MDNLSLTDGRTILVLMQFGSHLYGTHTAQSDTDLKGVFMPSPRDVYLGKIPKTIQQRTNPNPNGKNNKEDIDTELYSLHYFVHLACEGQTVAIDMLHAPADMILQKSPVWDTIILRRAEFYTKSLDAFVNYARRQAAKYGIKGSRLSSAQRVMNFLKERDPKATLGSIWEKLPEDEHAYKLPPDPNQFLLYEICGKRFQESTKIGHILPIMDRFCENFGQRAIQAARNEGIDWKAISHALRAAYQVRDLLTKGTIIFPLAEADYLREIKQGRRHYANEVAPHLEAIMAEVDALARDSSLPEQVNRAAWDDFLIRATQESCALHPVL